MSSRDNIFNPGNISGTSHRGGSSRSSDVFLKAIVDEVISNPIEYFSRLAKDNDGIDTDTTLGDFESNKVSLENATKKFNNSDIVPFVVQNSVSVRFVDTFKQSGKESKSYICLPFFPQHIALPIKPGEYVWVYKTSNSEFYWMCRLSTIRQVDDVNFTHLPRVVGVETSHKQMKDMNYFYNFNTVKGAAAPSDNFFHDIAKNSIAYREEFTGEIVPRMTKDCGDLLIQGSNNSHILLGKEKFEETSTTMAPEELTPHSNVDVNENRKPLSPAIDICVLRKARELFDLKDMIAAAKTAETVETSINEAHAGLGSGLSSAVGGRIENTGIEYFELEKARESLNPDLNKDIFTQEFIDSDIYNCIARIYMTNASTIDDLLFIPSLEGENSSSPQDVLGLGNYGAMAALGANTRIVGTETIKIQNIVGSSGIQFTPQGDVIIHANRTGGAKIVLEAAGDIRIVPGSAGIVKIGAVTDAEDSMFVPVGAFLSPLLPNTDTGYVGASEQIMTTAGGLLPTNDSAAPPGIPVYATKVKLY